MIPSGIAPSAANVAASAGAVVIVSAQDAPRGL
jgi:hypothetical protein